MRFFYFILAPLSFLLRLAVVISPWLFSDTSSGDLFDPFTPSIESFFWSLTWAFVTSQVFLRPELLAVGFLKYRQNSGRSFQSVGMRYSEPDSDSSCNSISDVSDPAHPMHYITPGTLGYMAVHFQHYTAHHDPYHPMHHDPYPMTVHD